MVSKKMTYNEAISEIEEILDKIESGQLDVDELTEKVKRVAALLKMCREKLKNTNDEVVKTLREIEE